MAGFVRCVGARQLVHAPPVFLEANDVLVLAFAEVRRLVSEEVHVEQRMVGGVTLRRRRERRQPRAADVVGIARSQKDDRRQKRHGLLRRDGKAVGAHERDEGNESPRGPGQGIDAAHATDSAIMASRRPET